MSSYLFNRWTLVSVGIVVGFAYYYNQKSGITNPIRQHTLFGDLRRRAVVIGATGATGSSLVHQLLTSNEWGKVTIIHRRLLDISKMDLTQQQQSKLHQHVVNMEQLVTEENIKLFKDHDITFCTLGTTRSIAKTAENWRKVDVHMVRDAAIASKKAGIRHFSLLTSASANANMWANNWKIFHGLLYLKSKGEIENEIMFAQFIRTSIFRPGLLHRGDKARLVEKVFSYMLRGTPVQDVARAMIYDAESTNTSDVVEVPVIYEAKDIQYLAKL
eukprot:375674_1